MADKSKERAGRWQKLLAMTAFLIAVAILTLPKPDYIHRFMDTERRLNAATLGEKIESDMANQTAIIMNDAFVKTGLYQKSMEWTDVSNGQIPMNWRNMTTWLQDRMTIIWSVVHMVVYRFFGFVVWLPFLLWLGLAMLIDAWFSREKSKWRFEFTSPIKHAIGAQLASWSIYASFVMLIFPFTIPSLVPLVLIIASMFGIWVLVSNLHKRL